MHPELIRAAIKMKGKTLTDVAKLAGVSRKVVSLALYSPSISGEKAISDFLGIPLHDLWPERWTREGERIRPRYAYLYKESVA